jgi:WD40 repeat protein
MNRRDSTSLYPSLPSSPPLDGLVGALHRQVLASELAGGPPPQVGKFIIRGKLGAGAMGFVFRAHDPHLGRDIALKFISDSYSGDPAFQRRLIAEAQTLARLDAPQIVPVYEFGEYAGQTYMAMKLHDGETMATWVLRARDWKDILDAYLQAGEGLAAAHRGACVHRDFKPDNVVIDHHGTVRVIDFGLARDLAAPLDPEVDFKRRLSMTDDVSDEVGVGSLSVGGASPYVAPELLQGQRADARSDQFAFCVAVHEGLGQLRWRRAHGRVPAAVRRALIRGLDADPARRWPSMVELLAALRAARHPRRILWFWISLMPAVALGLIVWVTREPPRVEPPPPPPLRIIKEQQIVTRIQAAPEPARARFAAQVLARLEDLVLPTAVVIAGHSQRVPWASIRLPTQISDAALSPKGTLVATVSEGRVQLWNADSTDDPVLLHDHGVSTLAFSHDGEKLAGTTDGYTVVLWNLDTSDEPVVLAGHDRNITSLTFSDDDRTILTTSWDTQARLWDVDTGRTLATLDPGRGLLSTGTLLHTRTMALTAAFDDTLQIWPLDVPWPSPGRVIPIGGEHGIAEVVLAGDDSYLAVRTFRDPGFTIQSPVGDATRIRPVDADAGEVTHLAVSSVDGTLAATYRDGAIRLWAAGRWSESPRVIQADTSISQFLFSPDGEHLVTASYEGVVHVWNPHDGGATFAVHHGAIDGPVGGLQFSTDSKRLLTVGGKIAQVWAMDDWITSRRVTGAVSGAAFDHKGLRIATWGPDDPDVTIFDAQGLDAPRQLVHPLDPEEPASLLSPVYGVTAVHFSPNDETVIVSTGNGVLEWETSAWAPPTMLEPIYRFNRDAAYSPDAKRIASLQDNLWQLHDATTHARLGKVELRTSTHGVIQFNASAEHVLIVNGDAHVYSLADFRDQRLNDPGQDVRVGCFSPDGEAVLLAIDDTAILYSPDGRILARLDGHLGDVLAVDFSRDGSSIATASGDGTVRLWSRDGVLLSVLKGHGGAVGAVQFSRDGKNVVSGSRDATARVWSLSSALQPVVLRGDKGEIQSVEFSPDGEQVLTRSPSAVRLWRWHPTALKEFVRSHTTACLTPDEIEDFMGLSTEDALADWQACERRHGRPGEWVIDAAAEHARKPKATRTEATWIQFPAAVPPRSPVSLLNALRGQVHRILCLAEVKPQSFCDEYRPLTIDEWRSALREGTVFANIITVKTRRCPCRGSTPERS